MNLTHTQKQILAAIYINMKTTSNVALSIKHNRTITSLAKREIVTVISRATGYDDVELLPLVVEYIDNSNSSWCIAVREVVAATV